MDIIRIDDINAAELAPYARLTEAQLKRAGEGGLFIAESINVIRSAIDGGYEPVSFLTESKYLSEIEALHGVDVPVYDAAPGVFEGITGFKLSRGVLAAMKRRELPAVESVVSGAKRVAVLENVVDATNIGAIFRSAAALGMDAVLVGSSCCDPLNRRAARVSMGTVFKVPWTVFEAPESDRNATDVEKLKALGFASAAMALVDDSVGVDDAAVRNEERLAVILGSEGYGLRPSTIKNCDYTVKIPMSNGVDSLNVAAASAVAFYALAASVKAEPDGRASQNAHFDIRRDI